MTQHTIYIGGSETVTVPATESIAVSNFGGGVAKIYYWIVAANVPDDWQYQQSIENEEVVLGPFSVAQLVRIDAGTSKVLFDIGASPATGTPASTLGGLTASQFLRSDADDDFTGSNLNLDNSSVLNGRDTGDTARAIAQVDGSDILQIGAAALPTNINSDGTLTHNSNPILDTSTLLKENILINSIFEINQRAAVSGANLSLVGDYFLDRWCAGTADSAPTWTGGVVTIPAGDSIKQIVEDINIPNGTYTLSWTGTSTASIDGGASQTSPHTFTVSSGTHVEVEFEEGTVSQPNLVPGSNAMAWYRKGYRKELDDCCRYFWTPSPRAGTGEIYWITYPTPMRDAVTIVELNAFSFSALGPNLTYGRAIVFNDAATQTYEFQISAEL